MHNDPTCCSTGACGQLRAVAAWSMAVAAALLAAGCSLREYVSNGFKVGPNYRRPAAPTAPEWIDYLNSEIQSEPADLRQWWTVFNDPALNGLIENAYRQNLTLREAGARVLQARAERGIAVGRFFPQTQDASGGYTRIKGSNRIAFQAPQQWFQTWSTQLGVAWELDFWGRYRRGIESADAELDASIENYDDVLVILLAEVASTYVELRTFQQRLRYAYQNVLIQRQALRLAQDKFRTGASTERDLRQAETTLADTRALVPELEAGLRNANNRLCVLLGMPPQELTDLGVGTYERTLRQVDARIEGLMADGTYVVPEDDPLRPIRQEVPPPPGAIPTAPATVAVGIPADLVRRRPDVRRAERQVAAQSARIGIAESDFYPQISLTGTLGAAAVQFADLGDIPASMIGNVGPSYRWAIFNYGRIVNNVRSQDAQFQQLAFAYQDTVLRAGEEAEDGIVNFLRSRERNQRLQESVRASSRTVDITYDQYQFGAVDFTPVFLFQSIVADAQDREAASRGDIALSLISLYKALGGGWEIRLSRLPPASAPALPAPDVNAPEPIPAPPG